MPGGRTRLQSAALHVNFGDASRWNGLVVLDRLEAADIAMEDVTLRLGGLAQNLEDPARRNVTINVEGLATGVWHADPEVARALGSRIDLFADAALPPEAPVQVRQLQISGNGLSIFSAGEFADWVYTGRNAIRVADLAIFAGIADRPLGGAIDLHAIGSVSPLSRRLRPRLRRRRHRPRARRRRGSTRCSPARRRSPGRAVRDETGIRTEDLRHRQPAAELRLERPDLEHARPTSASRPASPTSRCSTRGSRGALTATGRATGDGRPIRVALAARVPSGSVDGRALDEPRARLHRRGRRRRRRRQPRRLGRRSTAWCSTSPATSRSDGDRRSVDGLVVAVGPNRLTGSLAKAGAAPATGRLTLDAPDIAPVAALRWSRRPARSRPTSPSTPPRSARA